ncbi:hypothetical protein U3516DRAFT_769034 [Neocallimastix sp. 'constans']
MLFWKWLAIKKPNTKILKDRASALKLQGVTPRINTKLIWFLGQNHTLRNSKQNFMSIYNILFQGELWDIEEEDYYNYFDNITYFKECSEVEIYQYGNAEPSNT